MIKGCKFIVVVIAAVMAIGFLILGWFLRIYVLLMMTFILSRISRIRVQVVGEATVFVHCI